MDRALDLKPEVTRGCGFESRLWQEVSTTEVRPLSKAPNPQLLIKKCVISQPVVKFVGYLLLHDMNLKYNNDIVQISLMNGNVNG